jgi:hypothetical protein
MKNANVGQKYYSPKGRLVKKVVIVFISEFRIREESLFSV